MLKAMLEQSGLLPESAGTVQIDHLEENRPCVGLFSVGETLVSAADGRWKLSFLLQLTLYGADESSRRENQHLMERLSRWAAGYRGENVVSFWMGGGKLLYPAPDGLTFVYQLEGELVYREKTDDEPSCFGENIWWVRISGEEEWLPVIGMDAMEESTSLPEHGLVDRNGAVRRLAGTHKHQVIFEGLLDAAGSLPKKLLENPRAAVEWVCSKKENTHPAAARFGSGFLSVQKVQGEKIILQLLINKMTCGKIWQDDERRMSIWKE